MAGREEYLDSEKYQVRFWDLRRPGSLRALITRVNQIRKEHPALQQDRTLRFLATDNPTLLAFAKTAGDGSDPIVTVVNLDPRWRQAGWVEVPAQPLPRSPEYPVSDLLTESTYTWRTDRWNYVELDPSVQPAHLMSLERPLVQEGE